MTRGKIVLITDKYIFTSIEFNGDMYLKDGHGEEIIERLSRVKDCEDFIDEVIEFNDNNFGYDYNGIIGEVDEIDFSKDFYRNWSDFVYIKNIGKDREITLRNGNKDVIVEDEIVIFDEGVRYELCKVNG